MSEPTPEAAPLGWVVVGLYPDGSARTDWNTRVFDNRDTAVRYVDAANEQAGPYYRVGVVSLDEGPVGE